MYGLLFQVTPKLSCFIFSVYTKNIYLDIEIGRRLVSREFTATKGVLFTLHCLQIHSSFFFSLSNEDRLPSLTFKQSSIVCNVGMVWHWSVQHKSSYACGPRGVTELSVTMQMLLKKSMSESKTRSVVSLICSARLLIRILFNRDPYQWMTPNQILSFKPLDSKVIWWALSSISTI